MADTTYVQNDYQNWTVGLFTKYNSNANIQLISASNNYNETDSEADSYTFTLTRAANAAHLTVEGKRILHQGAEEPGLARQKIVLVKPDNSTVVLYDQSTYLPTMTNLLNSLDITQHLQTTGTYRLKLYGYVRSARTYIETQWHYWPSEVHYATVALIANTDVTVDIHLTEVVTPTEIFHKTKLGARLAEVVTPVERFSITKKSAPVSEQEITLVSLQTPAGQVYTFESGVLIGLAETVETDFGQPGVVKTLSEIQLYSLSEGPITVSIFVSKDSGTTWTYIEDITVQWGVPGFAFPWESAETFMVRFVGAALNMFMYALYAYPGAPVRPA